MTKITIDRAIVEQVLEALDYAERNHGGDDCYANSIAALHATLEQQAEPVACFIGVKGSAFDLPTTKRAYSYAEQPGDAVAYKLGVACIAAALRSAVDSIDRGLGLLKELQTQGFGVFDIGAEYVAQPQQAEPAQSGSCISCGNRMTGSPESFVVATAEVGVITPDGYSQQQVEALCSHKGGDVLSTPLSEPAQEPVAWMWEETAPRSSTGIGGIDRKLLFCRPADEPWNRNITPLYSAPPQQPVNLQDIEQYQLQMAGICTAALGYWTEDNSIHPDCDTPALRDVAKLYAKYAALYAAQSQRKPLTDEEIKSMWGITEYREFAIDFARAIERAHGIGDA